MKMEIFAARNAAGHLIERNDVEIIVVSLTSCSFGLGCSSSPRSLSAIRL